MTEPIRRKRADVAGRMATNPVKATTGGTVSSAPIVMHETGGVMTMNIGPGFAQKLITACEQAMAANAGIDGANGVLAGFLHAGYSRWVAKRERSAKAPATPEQQSQRFLEARLRMTNDLLDAVEKYGIENVYSHYVQKRAALREKLGLPPLDGHGGVQ